MSPRDTFWFLAGALAAIAVMLTVRAWRRQRASEQQPASQDQPPSVNPSEVQESSAASPASRRSIPAFAVPIAAALGLVGIALAIYFLIGSPDSIAAEHAGSQQVNANSSQSWPSAHPSSNGNAGSMEEVTRRLAARLAANGGSDDDWRLLEQSYEFLGRTEEAQAARMHIASADGAATVGADSGTVADSTSRDASPAVSSQPAAHAARIAGSINIAPALAARAGSGSALFIYAKQSNMPGPPLSVRRLRVERWPVSFELDDSNSMVPGRTLSGAGSVELEARISQSGEALPRPGDLVGHLSSVSTRQGGAVTVLIDHEIEH